MLIYVLLIFFIILLISSYFSTKKDIIHPVFIFNLMFLISIGCAIYNIDRWNIDISNMTFLLLVLMAIEFNILSYIIMKYYEPKKENITDVKMKSIKIEKSQMTFVIIFDIIYIALIVYFVGQIALRFGNVSSYSEALKIYKANVIYKANASLPIVVRIANKFVIGFSYIFMFAAIYNFVYVKYTKRRYKIRNFIIYMIPTFLYAISLLLQSSRGMILRMICSGAIIYIILWYRKNKYIVHVRMKYILGIFAAGIVTLVSFYLVSGLIGRSVLNSNVTEYVTMYGGGSIQLLDMYMDNQPEKSNLVGRETFWGVYRFLADYKLIKISPKPTGSLEWRESNDYMIGNVYTAYRRWYQDFGIVGCAIILGIVCLFFNIYYLKLKECRESNKYNLLLLLYSYLFYHLILISIDCRIFDEIIPASISQFIVTLLIYYIFIYNSFENNELLESHITVKETKNMNYEDALEELNKDYLNLYDSEEYRVGRKFLIIKYYLKKFKFVTLFKKIYRSKMKNKNSIKNNFDNDTLFKDNQIYIENSYNGEKVAIYTVNIGGYDTVLQPIIKSENVDYFYVSDKKPSNLGKWEWIDANKFIKDLDTTNVKKARYIKTHPHLIFKDYKYSIFIDGNIRTVVDISKFVNNINKKTKIAIHPHPYRECIYDEAINCKRSGKGNNKEIDKQIETYRNEGMPEKYGLFETNVVVREHNNELCKKIMEDWWNEIFTKSERDQLSLTYVLWKNKLKSNDIGIICDSIKNNYGLQVLNHLDEYKKK